MGAAAYGVDPAGGFFNDHLFQGGGQGAGLRADGKSALLYPTSAGNTSIEMFETRTPLLVGEKALLADSGGAGRHRGGLGQRVTVSKLYDDGRPALLSLHPQGMIVATPGLKGGSAGRRSSIALTTRAGTLRDVELAGMAELREAADLCVIEMPGGSGFGAPQERDPAALERDLREGWVTPEGAGAYRREDG
jgi:5-oxoprolinase (ATP-hydrolysing)/N-methylhydantoinase A